MHILGAGWGAALAAPQEPPQRPQAAKAARRAAGLRPVLTLCRDWVRGREQSKTCREQVPCGQSTRRQKAVDEGILEAYNENNKMGK